VGPSPRLNFGQDNVRLSVIGSFRHDRRDCSRAAGERCLRFGMIAEPRAIKP
jgi:hypothetical protein